MGPWAGSSLRVGQRAGDPALPYFSRPIPAYVLGPMFPRSITSRSSRHLPWRASLSGPASNFVPHLLDDQSGR